MAKNQKNIKVKKNLQLRFSDFVIRAARSNFSRVDYDVIGIGYCVIRHATAAAARRSDVIVLALCDVTLLAGG